MSRYTKSKKKRNGIVVEDMSGTTARMTATTVGISGARKMLQGALDDTATRPTTDDGRTITELHTLGTLRGKVCSLPSSDADYLCKRFACDNEGGDAYRLDNVDSALDLVERLGDGFATTFFVFRGGIYSSCSMCHTLYPHDKQVA